MLCSLCTVLVINGAIGTFKLFLNRIGGVMVSVPALSALDLGSSPGRIKPKTIKLVFIYIAPLITKTVHKLHSMHLPVKRTAGVSQ
jgi:hypothetical protein